LVGAVVKRLARAGIDSMLVWVLAANPSRRFYEALGGRQVCEKQIEIGGVMLDEIAYGWADVRSHFRGDPDPGYNGPEEIRR
jgi:FR47-like protein